MSNSGIDSLLTTTLLITTNAQVRQLQGRVEAALREDLRTHGRPNHQHNRGYHISSSRTNNDSHDSNDTTACCTRDLVDPLLDPIRLNLLRVLLAWTSASDALIEIKQDNRGSSRGAVMESDGTLKISLTGPKIHQAAVRV